MAKDLLEGITPAQILAQLEAHYGWPALGALIDIRCFQQNPSIKSSLTFLRRTPWARSKVEEMYRQLVSCGRITPPGAD
ncbi:MAG: hypothetical protein RL497_595 [Pseudomonadota bacterium]|jgi:uncharacterized protein (DUF2132 family)